MAEEIKDGATSYKCAPPIREKSNREQLWAALGEGLLELVASDHSPCTPALKKQEVGDFMAALALLHDRPRPTDADIDARVTNACRCGTYHRVRQAIHLAAELMGRRA